MVGTPGKKTSDAHAQAENLNAKCAEMHFNKSKLTPPSLVRWLWRN